MAQNPLLVLVALLTFASSLVATPLIAPIVNALSDVHHDRSTGNQPRNVVPASQHANPSISTDLTVGDKLIYNYLVPGSPIAVYFIIDTTHPIERAAMGRTILLEQQTLRKRLEKSGNAWLSIEDDPYEFDDRMTGKCMIGMKSYHVGGDDGARLTYRGVFDALQALWHVLYIKNRTYEAIFQVENSTYLVANGKVTVGNSSGLVQLSATKGRGVTQWA